jgi:hypothetical protein
LTKVRTTAGKRLHLGKMLAKDGEGKVCRVEGQPDSVAKPYTDGKESQRRETPQAMAAAGLHKQEAGKFVAFPQRPWTPPPLRPVALGVARVNWRKVMAGAITAGVFAAAVWIQTPDLIYGGGGAASSQTGRQKPVFPASIAAPPAPVLPAPAPALPAPLALPAPPEEQRREPTGTGSLGSAGPTDVVPIGQRGAVGIGKEALNTGVIALRDLRDESARPSREVRLHGIEPSNDSARVQRLTQFIRNRPVKCAPMGGGEHRCAVGDSKEDVGKFLLSYGLARAAPNAPKEYHDMELLAKGAHRGVWRPGGGER